MSDRAACSVTHEQLIEGDCPWCRRFLAGPNDRTSSEPPPQRRWNYPLMLRVALNGDKEQKALTLSNIARDSDDLTGAASTTSTQGSQTQARLGSCRNGTGSLSCYRPRMARRSLAAPGGGSVRGW